VVHVEAHIHAVFLEDERWLPPDTPRPVPPYLALAVSGGHTSLLRVEPDGATTLVAYTLDDAAGEAFDKVAKLLALPYPGGVSIDRLSEQGDRAAVAFPRPLARRTERAFSFSGLKTAARLVIEDLAARGRAGAGTPLDPAATADVAASFQEAVVEVLVRKTLQAAHDLHLDQVVVAGGVAANRRLRAVFTEATAAANVRLFLTPTVYCTDNAAMVAGLGRRHLAAGRAIRGADVLTLDAYANAAFGPRTKGVRRG
jgi:N6-L-threonylcarbamoyladenine synthase